jgi:hypothetical protein
MIFSTYCKLMEMVQLLVKSEVITVLMLKIQVFGNVTMCSQMGGCHCSCTA